MDKVSNLRELQNDLPLPLPDDLTLQAHVSVPGSVEQSQNGLHAQLDITIEDGPKTPQVQTKNVEKPQKESLLTEEPRAPPQKSDSAYIYIIIAAGLIVISVLAGSLIRKNNLLRKEI